jgi:riboflavin kinase/FMN adenylyltransferase
MKIYNKISSVSNNFCDSVLAIGNFDGVHLGHQLLFRKARSYSLKKKKKFGILTFDPLPKDFFTRSNNRILDISNKINIIKKFNADFFIKQNFNKSFSSIKHENFAQNFLKDKLKVFSIFVGKDFRFGFKRKGDVSFLKKFSRFNKFKISVIKFKKLNNSKISSSKIRDLIQSGQIHLANKFMGREWSISGKVIKGKKIGTGIGFPTANIKISGQIKPMFGVYSVRIFFNKRRYDGIANYGVRPTFSGSDPILEVNVFGKNHNLYNKNVSVLFVEFIRKEKKFKNISMLVDQIKKDIKIAKISLKKNNVRYKN